MGKKAEYSAGNITRICLLLLLIFLTAACAGAPPRIGQLFWQLDVVLNTQTGSQIEELTLFMLIDDADGIDDVERISLIHEQEELVWNLPREDLRLIQREGEDWLGVSGVQMHDGSTLPRGRYLVEVTDRAGEKAQTDFSLDRKIAGLTGGPVDKNRFPALERIGTEVTARPKIRSENPQVNVFFYNARNEFLQSETVAVDAFTAETIRKWMDTGIRSVWLHSYDAEAGFGLAAGPFPLWQ